MRFVLEKPAMCPMFPRWEFDRGELPDRGALPLMRWDSVTEFKRRVLLRIIWRYVITYLFIRQETAHGAGTEGLGRLGRQ